MTDWKSIKKAADGLPSIGVEPMGGKSSRLGTPSFSQELVADRRSHAPAGRSAFTPNRHPLSGIGSTYSLPGNDGMWFTTLKRSDIRPLLYGNKAREEQETREAYENRWRRLYEIARSDEDRRILDQRRAAGQIPPIVMRHALSIPSGVLNGNEFYDPGEYVQATVAPRTGRSAANPQGGNLFIGADDNQMRRTYREEFAHMAAPTVFDSPSLLYGVPAGDAGTKAYDSGRVGSYELDPAEMTRFMLLQKAAAGRLGLPRFRTVDEWREFNRRQGWWPAKGVQAPSGETMDNPYRWGGMLDESTRSQSLMDTLDTLEKRAASEQDPGKRKIYEEYYKRLRESLQDAIDMARTGGTSGETMNA